MNSQSIGSESFYSPENVLRFAGYLKSQKEYLAAATEYRRYLLMKNEPDDSIAVLIGKCYLLGERNDLAMNYLSASSLQNSNEAILLQSYAFFLDGSYDSCIQILKKNNDNPPTSEVKEQREFLSAASSFIVNSENDTFNISQNDTTVMMKSLLTLVTERKHYTLMKSPLFAAGLSAVVPGLGKIYGGQIIDGVFSFVSIALATWQAYDGFSDEGSSSVKGWLVGSLAATFYVGNIYGSAVNIELQNHIQQTKFEDDVRTLVKTSFRF
ncbi:MAG: hypothetical protein HYZ34_11120 [Ignavibacteriae bacterium]|nr:hypothetical protein [Ignavibacteriota bacterium]